MDGQDLHPISNMVSVPAIGTVVQVGTVAGGIHVPEPGPGSSSYVPRQLPAPPVRFTGRETDLARLTQAVSQGPAGTVVISAVGGAGGIGKTWLVLQWAHRHLDRFPDGQLHVDLRGFSPDSTPMPTSVALRGFLCALGVPPAAIPVEEHAQAALFRSVAAGRRMLIVLDNAVDTEQITSLLPGSPSCTVLVTSRRRLTGLISSYGAQQLALDVLPDKDAWALLAARLGDARLACEPAAADQLIAACGGFPLALSVVAGQAAAHPDLPLTAMVSELRGAGLAGLDDGDTAASVPAVLSWSYRALAPGNAHAFALLGIAPGPDISLAAAASLTGKSLGEARTVLRDLEQASLLIRHTGNRYSMHDLTRACARDHAEHDLATQDRKSALDRVIDFYVHTAHHAHLVLEPHDHHLALNRPVPGCRPQPLTTHAEALAWFALDHPCLLETQRTAQQNGPLWAVWQLAWALTAYHNLRGLLADGVAEKVPPVVAIRQVDEVELPRGVHRRPWWLRGPFCRNLLRASNRRPGLAQLAQSSRVRRRKLLVRRHSHTSLCSEWHCRRDPARQRLSLEQRGRGQLGHDHIEDHADSARPGRDEEPGFASSTRPSSDRPPCRGPSASIASRNTGRGLAVLIMVKLTITVHRSKGITAPTFGQINKKVRSGIVSMQGVPQSGVAVDLAILTVRVHTLCALVIERATPPDLGRLALPGGFLRDGETLDQTADRKLAQETGLDTTELHIHQLHTYSAPDRDPRGRIVSVLYVALMPDLPLPVAGGGAATATWIPVDEVLADPTTLAFDHHQMLADALEHARESLSGTTLAVSFCPPSFTIAQLRRVYETIWNVDLDPANFHRKVTRADDFLVPTGDKVTDGGRPAALFRAGTATRLHPAIQREDAYSPRGQPGVRSP